MKRRILWNAGEKELKWQSEKYAVYYLKVIKLMIQ
jgi:hypothetical protein